MIVPMKKATVYALFDDRAALLSALQRRRLLMVEDDGSAKIAADAIKQKEDSLASAAAALSFAETFRGKEAIFAAKPGLVFDELVGDNEEDSALAGRMLSLKEKIQSAGNRVAALRSANSALLPWLRLSAPVEDIKDTRYVKVRTGFIPGRPDFFAGEIEDAGGSVEVLGEGVSGFAALLLSHRDFDEEVTAKAKDLGFAEAAPPRFEGTAASAYSRNEEEIAELGREIEELKLEAAGAAGDIRPLRRFRDREATGLARDGVRCGETDSVFYVTGWIRSDREAEFRKAVESVTDVCAVEVRGPTEDENPPTVTKNGKFITQFEAITDMFSRPGARDTVDPNPVMGIWYWIIFGMMMGDVGYGLLMIVFIGAFKFITKNNGKMVNILFFSGFTTVVWGAVFGSYFGEELLPPLILAPLDNILLSMGICLGIGALHIFSGIGMQMYIDFKEGRPWDAIFDQLSQIAAIIGLVMLFVGPLKTAGTVVTLLGLGTMLLTGGRSKPNVFGKFLGGLGKIYNSIIGIFSDILSYARILALMLSSGIIAMVMNIFADMVMPSEGSGIVGTVIGLLFGLAIYIVGHIFNLVLSLLSAYVHDSRLQYLEFFGKFYEGGGYAFEPLAPDVKYVEVKDAEKA